MAGKPFSIQAPETIAKEYGGNKQKIAQAVQSGLIDPTAGVLAGMFIDRMRSAQMAERAPAPSVAQQVLAPQSVAPAGLGAMPPGGAPAAMPQMAPAPGMADGGYVPPYAKGGLDDLPLPDTMFDEPTNGGFDDGYSGGGMVAFDDGGDVTLEALRARVRAARSAEEYETAKAALDEYKGTVIARRRGKAITDFLTGNTGVSPRDIWNKYAYYDQTTSPKLDLSKPQMDMGTTQPVTPEQMRAAFNLPPPAPMPPAMNMGTTQPVTPEQMRAALNLPAPNTQTPPATPTAAPTGVRSAAPRAAPRPVAGGLGAIAPTAPTAPAAPESAPANTLEDSVNLYKKLVGADEGSPARDKLRQSLADIMSPDAEGKAKDDAKWMALAQIGASLAASKSPYFLQAAGEAMQGAIPGVAAARKERKDEVRQALAAQADLENMDRAEKRDYVKAGMDYHNQAEQLRMEGDKLKLQGKIAEAEEKYRMASLAQQYALGMAGIEVQREAARRPSSFMEMLNAYKTDKPATEAILGLQHPGRSGTGTSAEEVANRLRGPKVAGGRIISVTPAE